MTLTEWTDGRDGRDESFNVTVRRRILRALFFGAETGSVIGALSFLWIANASARPPRPAYDQMGAVVVGMVVLLIVVSLFLWRTERSLAKCGLFTGLLILVGAVVIPML